MRFLILSLLTVLFLCGCENNVYELKMRLDKDTLHRELTFYREGAVITFGDSDSASKTALKPFPEKELERITRVYQCEPKSPEKNKHVIKASFQNITPNDVGGSGLLSYASSPMGSFTVFVEKFRGEDDVAGRLERALTGVDRICEHFLTWLALDMGGEDWWPRFAEFVEFEIKQDLKNVMVMFWRGGFANSEFMDENDKEKKVKKLLAETLLYLSDRQYVFTHEIPIIKRVIDGSVLSPFGGKDMFDERTRQSVSQILKRIFIRKLDHPQSGRICERLISFFDPEKAEASLDRYLKSTDIWKIEKAKWDKKKLEDPDLKPLKTDVVTTQYFNDIVLLMIPMSVTNNNLKLDERHQISIEFDSPKKPFDTNGLWDPEKGAIFWKGEMYDNQSPPALIYATWVTPNGAYQKARFNRMLLEGEDLMEYVIWYEGLTKDEKEEWDEFLHDITPEDDLKERLKLKESLGQNKSLMKTPRDLLTR